MGQNVQQILSINNSSTKLAIMQPTYLPWMGYFDLMDQVDTFVILDNVQFSKQSWQQRNRLKSAQGELLLTIPVVTKGKGDQLITDVQLANHHFLNKHLNAIEMNYRRTPYFETYFQELKVLFECAHRFTYLHEFTLSLIVWIKHKLGITTKIISASDFNLSNEKINRIIELCKHLNVSHYISPKGAIDYLSPFLASFQKENIVVSFQQYEPISYKQLYPPFLSHLSSLDLLFNEGPNALTIIHKGRKNEGVDTCSRQKMINLSR